MQLRDPRSEGNAEPLDRLGLPLERQALDELFSATYEELRRLAFSVKRNDPSATLTPTALVNEAYLRLGNDGAFKGAWARLGEARLRLRSV